jgi:hypothetical protein
VNSAQAAANRQTLAGIVNGMPLFWVITEPGWQLACSNSTNWGVNTCKSSWMSAVSH